MIARAVVRAGGIIKVLSDSAEAACNKYHHRNEPRGGAGSALGHVKSFVGAARGANVSEGDNVRVDRSLSKRQEKNRHRECQALRRHRNCNTWYLGDLIKVLALDCNENVARFRRNAYERA